MNYSFGIKTFEDYWSSTIGAEDKYLADSLNENLARECANKLWHMCDWFFEEYKVSLKYKQLSELQGEVGAECNGLRVMRDVCNGAKHAGLEKTRNPVIKDASRHNGAFSPGFSRDFDVSVLEVELVDGTKVCFDNAVKESLEFWQKKIKP